MSEPRNNAHIDSSQMVETIGEHSQQSRDAQVESATAQYDMALDQQLTELEHVYNQAVADGEMGVEQARRDFEKNKMEIQDMAYKTAEATGLHAHQQGIQNSQQMIGLMQGDQARNQRLHNENRSDKQHRIADIQTRLNNIRKQKGLDMASARNQRNLNVNQATAQADMQHSQNMFGVMQDDFSQRRSHEMALRQMEAQTNEQMLMIAQKHKNNKETMIKELANQLTMIGARGEEERRTATHQGNIQRQNIQAQGAQTRANQAQSHQLQLQRMHEQVAVERQQQEQAMLRELESYENPNSPAYRLRKAQINEEMDQWEAQQMAQVAGTIAEQISIGEYNSTMEAANTQGVSEPRGAFQGGLGGAIEDTARMSLWWAGQDPWARERAEQEEYARLQANERAQQPENAIPQIFDTHSQVMDSFRRRLNR